MMRIRVLSGIPYAWVVVALCVGITMASASFTMSLGALFPFLHEDLGFNRAELGLIPSTILVGGTGSVLLVGWLADVMGVRRLLTVALLGTVVGVILFSQVQSLFQALLLATFIGVVRSPLFPACTKAIMDWVTPRTRGLAMGLSEASIPAAGIMAALLVSVLSVAYSWRVAVIACGIIIAVSTIAFFVFYKDKAGDGGRERGGRTRGSMRLVVKNRDIWLASMAGAFLAASQVTFTSYLVLLLREDVGASALVAGSSLSVFLAGGAIGRLALPLVSDLLMGGRRVRLLSTVGLASGMAIALISWLPSGTAPATVLAVVLVMGLITMSWSGLWTVLVAELAGPALTGTAIGFASMTNRLVAFGTAPLFGLLVDRTGSYDIGLWVIATMAGVGTVLLAFLRPEASSQ